MNSIARKKRKARASGAPPAPAAKRPHRRLPWWKKALFGLVVTVLFLAACEIVLALCGVSTVLETEDPFRGFSGLVPVFRKDQAQGVYTSDLPANAGTFDPQSFLVKKPPNGLRIFCIGGSSAYGFPWGAEAAFTAILGEAVAAAHPELAVEAVNASGVSYASHRLRILAKEILRYRPDVLIIYSGHNEFIEKKFYRSVRERAEAYGRLNYILYSSRLYSLMHSALSPRKTKPGPGSPDAPPADDLLGIRVYRDMGEAVGEAERRQLEAFFGENIRAICRMAAAAGVKVILCTVPANVRDWKPERAPGRPDLPAGRRRTWRQALARAESALAAKQYAPALEQLRQALELAPEDPVTHFLIGRAREGLQEWESARQAYLRACELDATLCRATEAVNTAIREIARQEGAILVDVEKLFAGKSPHALIGYGLIEDYVHPTRRGHEEIAFAIWQAMRADSLLAAQAGLEPRELFEKIVRARRARGLSTEATARYLYNQGVMLVNQGRWKDAIRKFRECVKLAPTYVSAQYNLGLALAREGDLIQAEEHYRLALGSDPRFADAHVGLGDVLINRGKLPEAVACLTKALQLKPDSHVAHNKLGIALGMQNRLGRAVMHFARALEINPNYSEAHNNMGLARARQGRLDLAVRHYRQALRLNPDSPEAHDNLGLALAGQRRFEQALRHHRAALRIEPHFVKARFNIANVLALQGKTGQAVKHLEALLERRPDFQPARALLDRLRGRSP